MKILNRQIHITKCLTLCEVKRGDYLVVVSPF